MCWCCQTHSSAECIRSNDTDSEAIPPSNNASRSPRSPSGWGTVILNPQSNWSQSTGRGNQTRTLNPIQLSRNPPIQLEPLTETSEPKGMSWCWQAHSSAEPIQGNATDREAIPPSHNASRSTRSPSGWGTVIPTH